MQKSYLYELQIMRGIALLSVVLIHLINMCTLKLPKGDLTYGFYYTLGNAAQYAVPSFLLIAAIVVGFGEKKINDNLFRFYRSKILRIIVPYVGWSVLYILIRYITGSITEQQITSVRAWIFWLLWGKGYGHLYFMSIILQFYVVVPLLLILVKFLKDRLYLMITVTIFIQLIFYFINKQYVYAHFPYPATLLMRYLCIVIPGIWIGFNYEKVMSWLNRYWYFVGIAFLIIGSFYAYDCVRLFNKLPIKSFPHQMIWYGYVLCASILWIKVSYGLSQKDMKITSWFRWLGKMSFGIYLMHPLFIAVINKFFKFSNAFFAFVLLAAGLFVICIVTGKIVEYAGKIPVIGLAVGEVPKFSNSKKNRINKSNSEAL